MFWKRRKKAAGEPPENRATAGAADPPPAKSGQAPAHGPLRVMRDAPRPATILKVADDLERRGGKVIELFRELRSPDGRVVLPIHLMPDPSGRKGEVFIEVETAPWEAGKTRDVIEKAAVVRASEHAGADLELLSAYPAPRDATFFFSFEPAALLQLELFYCDLEDPEASAGMFVGAARRHWGADLDYSPESLSLVEELLLAAFDDARSRYPDLKEVPVLDGLATGLGYYIGEVIRRHSGRQASWGPGEEWSAGRVLQFPLLAADPVGKAHAFLSKGAEDSISYYARYALSELKKTGYSGVTARDLWS